jgi:hypothetical protein
MYQIEEVKHPNAEHSRPQNQYQIEVEPREHPQPKPYRYATNERWPNTEELKTFS